MEAGHLAGFEDITMINEPTSASLAYQLDLTESETVMVFDLGGVPLTYLLYKYLQLLMIVIPLRIVTILSNRLLWHISR